MNNTSDFYDNLDLKYPEIGIAIQDIDRTNPGKVKFIIPVLTPNMDTSKIVEQKAYQNSSNLMNGEKNIEIENINITNYIEILMPKEVCSISSGNFKITSNGSAQTRIEGSITIGGSTGSSGGIESHTHSALSGSGSANLNGSSTLNGVFNLTPVDRYIKKGSKWIIVFVGGDITKPRVIARYPED